MVCRHFEVPPRSGGAFLCALQTAPTSIGHTIDQAFVIGWAAHWQAIEAGSSVGRESGKPLKFDEKL
jgi:hypothetical protein